jgi:DMSO/TMAO reductase YedYZ molybdopterin-dependent catalytic subunit
VASRRSFLVAVGAAAATLVTLTAGQSFGALDALNIFAPRKSGVGPQGLPVNRTAKAADVVESATAADWMLTITSDTATRQLDYAALRALPQHEAVLPIACVEGWSQYAHWSGPRLADVVALVAAPADASLRIRSLQTNSIYGTTTMQPEFVRDELTLVALDLNGEPLHLDHGFPARVIAPARPGVLQTKWLSTIEVLS